MFRGTGFTPHC